MLSKILAVVVNRENLQAMKQSLLEHQESDDDLIVEEKYRRISRIVIAILYLLYFVTAVLSFFLPMFEAEEFSMPVHVQLPGTK